MYYLPVSIDVTGECMLSEDGGWIFKLDEPLLTTPDSEFLPVKFK